MAAMHMNTVVCTVVCWYRLHSGLRLSGKAWDKIDAWYLYAPSARITTDADNDTKVAASAAEERAHLEERGAVDTGPVRETVCRPFFVSPSSFLQAHFVCECFFMTAKALRLGAVKTMQQTESEASLIGRLRVGAFAAEFRVVEESRFCRTCVCLET